MSDALNEIRRFAKPQRPSQKVMLTYGILAVLVLFSPSFLDVDLCGVSSSIFGLVAFAFITWRLLQSSLSKGIPVVITPHRLSVGERSFLWEEIRAISFVPEIEITLQDGETIDSLGCTLLLRDADALQSAADQALARARALPADDAPREDLERILRAKQAERITG